MSFVGIFLTLVLATAVRSQSSPSTLPETLPIIEVLTLESGDGDDSGNSGSEFESLVPSPSVDRFTFTEEDAKPTRPKVEDNDITADTDTADALVLFETLLEEGDKASSDDESIIEDKKSDDGDNDEDDDVIDNEYDDVSTDSRKIYTAPKQVDQTSVRRKGDQNIDTSDSLQSRQDNGQNSPPLYYAGQRNLANSGESVGGVSPLLLTQGGYRRPYQRRIPFNDQSQSFRPFSVSEASETVETPVESENTGERTIQPHIVPQVSYSSGYQPQGSIGNGPVYQHPFSPSNAYLNTNNPSPQNGFYNAAPPSFPEFTANHFHPQFTPSDESGFQSMFQQPPRHVLQNPGVLFQSPPMYPTSMTPEAQRPMHIFTPFNNYPSPDNYEGTSRPDYSSFFRIPSPISLSQMQSNPNYYGTAVNSPGNSFQHPIINLLPNHPRNSERPFFSPQFLAYPSPNGQINVQNTDQLVQKEQQDSEAGAKEGKTNEDEQINVSPNKEDLTSVPFGERIQLQNETPEKTDTAGQSDVYIRYPSEAGYATEENLPVQNISDKTSSNNDPPQRADFPFPNQYPRFSSPDPYRNALHLVQQGIIREQIATNNDSNNTYEKPPELPPRNMPFPLNPAQPQSPLFAPAYDQRLPVFQRGPFYVAPSRENPFDTSPIFTQRNYQLPPESAAETSEIPLCAKGTNASLCFNDPEYPRRELMYALNSDSFLLDRLVMPDQELDGISLVEQNATENADSDGNYICKSVLKYGMPLRAKNIQDVWKVIVNVERAIGRGKFIQPVRLEVCREVNEPCSFTSDIKTACVQKYSLQRLLSWSPDKGVHNDVYRLPIACSCQIVGASKAAEK